MRFLKRSLALLLLIFALNGPQYARAVRPHGLTALGLPFPGAGPRLHWMVGRLRSARGTGEYDPRPVNSHGGAERNAE